MSVLVHLVDPAVWRAALDEGALRPPSLTRQGFVHLSTPEQVHLPAARLFPGRRDLALLVVDPARLTHPVRREPGSRPPSRVPPGDFMACSRPPGRMRILLGPAELAHVWCTRARP